MEIFYDLKDYGEQNSIVTIGTFDGIHLGHQSVLEQLKNTAKAKNGKSVVFTFFPHPRLVVEKDPDKLRLLTTLEEKIELLRQIEIDILVIFPFTLDFASLSYEEFVKTVLVGQLNMKHLVIGYDHKFGKNREGSFENLKKLSIKYHFGIEKLNVYLHSEINVSSTKIRNQLEIGNAETANKFLGYRYRLTGKVVKGKQLGRTIGYPTANVQPSDPNKMVPKVGVYAVKILVDDHLYEGMLNIGFRPTIETQIDNRSIEVHIFNLNMDLYDRIITIEFHKWIRDEEKFNSIELLKQQLQHDEKVIKLALNGK